MDCGKHCTKGTHRSFVHRKATDWRVAARKSGNAKRTHLLSTSFASKKTFPLSGSSRVVCATRSLPGVVLGAVNFQSYVCFILMNGDTWNSFSNLGQTRAGVAVVETYRDKALSPLAHT